MATKQNLVNKLSQKLDYLSPEDARFAVDTVLELIKEELADGGRVEIRGFGSLSVRKRKYAGENEEYNSVYYRMSKNVQDDLN